MICKICENEIKPGENKDMEGFDWDSKHGKCMNKIFARSQNNDCRYCGEPLSYDCNTSEQHCPEMIFKGF